MNRNERSWGALVITAFVLVSLFVIALAAIKGCGSSTADTSSVTADAAPPSPQGEGNAEPEPEVVAEIPPREYIGTCRLTVYTPHESNYGYQTATGAKSQHLMTCAVDPKVIPYGSNVIVVDKDGEEWRFKAIDCGGFSGKWIDIFFDGSELGGIYWLDEVFGGDRADVYVEAQV